MAAKKQFLFSRVEISISKSYLGLRSDIERALIRRTMKAIRVISRQWYDPRHFDHQFERLFLEDSIHYLKATIKRRRAPSGIRRSVLPLARLIFFVMFEKQMGKYMNCCLSNNETSVVPVSEEFAGYICRVFLYMQGKIPCY